MGGFNARMKLRSSMLAVTTTLSLQRMSMSRRSSERSMPEFLGDLPLEERDDLDMSSGPLGLSGKVMEGEEKNGEGEETKEGEETRDGKETKSDEETEPDKETEGRGEADAEAAPDEEAKGRGEAAPDEEVKGDE